ncbi:MAG TPA: AAA family ATPase [Nocardioidaceae bacterium]|nr:AAA family ATPase [Nocardioidaceae bacterium]
MTGRLFEIAGPAGAGKTTLVTNLLAHDPSTRLGLDSDRLRLGLGLLSVAPALAAARVSAGGRGFSRAELRSISYLRAWRGSARDSRPDGVVLLDHGPVYRLAALAAYGPPMADAPAFRRWWSATATAWSSLLDGVVRLDAPDDVLLQRINGRPREHRVRNVEVAEVNSFLSRYRRAYDAALDLMTREGVPVLNVDTSLHSPDDLAHVVHTALSRPAGWSG